MAMTLVSTVTVGSGGAASIEFTNIPQTGKDLLLLFSGRTDSSGTFTSLYLGLNGYFTQTYRRLTGDGSTAESGSNTGNVTMPTAINVSGSTSNTFSSMSFYLSNYTSSSTKSASIDNVTENNDTYAQQHLLAWRYDWNNDPITGLTLDPLAGNLVQYSTASLYIIS